VPVDVATFLLNEKRADIQAVELRHKVSILLIPNIHLETPSHDIIRLKHDELNADDVREPSYKLVEAPSEEKEGAENGKAESPRPRQEAALKGITPDKPAPVVVVETPTEAAAPGILSRFLSWFKSSSPAPQPAAPTGRKNRDGNRRNGQSRGEQAQQGEPRRKNRNETRRGEERDIEKADKSGNERQNRNEQRNGERGRHRSESHNETRETSAEPAIPRERKQREPRRERPQATESATPEIQNIEPTMENGAESSNSRRRNNRRGRNRSNASEAAVDTVPNNAVEMPSAPISSGDGPTNTSANVSDTRVSSPVENQPPAETAPEKAPVASRNASVADVGALPDKTPSAFVSPTPIAPASDSVPGVPAAPMIAGEVNTTPSQPAEPFPIPATSGVPLTPSPQKTPVVALAPTSAPSLNLETELKESGLILVQTTGAFTPASSTEPAEPPRGRPRRHKPVVAQNEETLVMVETQQ
jgi:ribonuclease E